MFKFIKFLANRLSLFLCKTDNSKENYDYYEYAIIGYLSFSFYCIVAIILSILLKYFPYIFIIIPCLLSLRSQSGGSHAKTPFWCFIATTMAYLIIGLSTYLNKYYLIIFFISFIGFSGIKDIPKYTKTATQHSEEKQKFFQLNYVIRLNMVFLINIMSIILFMQGYIFEINNIVIDFSKISCALSFCIMVNRFSLSDLCFALLDKTGKDTE